jgi:ribosomal protein L28
MSNIGGKKREQGNNSSDSKKRVGLFEANVIAINPTIEEFKDKLGIELKEDSKAADYLGTSQDGNKTLRVDIWLEEVKSKDKFKAVFFLENKERENKDGSKKQYINSVGSCSWADDENNLPKWFTERDVRVAYMGEEDLYNFLRTWLGNLDYRDAETTLQLDWSKLMKGNVKDLRDQINGEWCTNVVALATVKTVEKDGDIKEYQGVYNKGFLPAYTLKQFRLVDFSSSTILKGLREKKSKDLKPHERFVLNVTGEYGCKEFYTFKDLAEYNADDNLVASDRVLEEDDSDF